MADNAELEEIELNTLPILGANQFLDAVETPNRELIKVLVSFFSTTGGHFEVSEEKARIKARIGIMRWESKESIINKLMSIVGYNPEMADIVERISEVFHNDNKLPYELQPRSKGWDVLLREVIEVIRMYTYERYLESLDPTLASPTIDEP